ncbi:MAG: serine/threonine protein kinase [Candidatus Obscuribacter sp.]|nr:serine/threonine protein kinase [Candidatus Obscuribacter sp.]
MIAGPKRLGSFTAFLLKDLRCGCAKPLLQVAGANAMETRYRPPQATWGKRKEQMQTALRTRASNTFARDAALVSLAPGTTIGGCYQLIEMVGKGGMGVVYKARHTALNRILALKFVAPSMVSHESWQLFQQEAKLNATLSHPSLCQIYDLGIHANALPYYAMDFVDGQTLEEIIINSGPLSVGATLEIFIKVAEGLSYAHRRNVVHRDIKPANIMIQSTTGDTVEVKLLDFGIAELSEKQGKKGGQKTERIIGSAAYMSPEQFADGRPTPAPTSTAWAALSLRLSPGHCLLKAKTLIHWTGNTQQPNLHSCRILQILPTRSNLRRSSENACTKAVTDAIKTPVN